MHRVATEYKGRVYAVILTIRQDETDAVIRRLGELETVQGRLGYRVGRVRRAGHDMAIAVHRIREQGTSPAQAAATNAIEDLDPRLLVLVGIAGAVPTDEFSLGDVMVATRVTDLRVQALLPEHRRELSIRSDRGHPGLIDRLTNLSKFDEWAGAESIGLPQPEVPLAQDKFTGDEAWSKKVRESLRRSFRDGPRKPRYVTGEIGSQDALVKDPEILKNWLIGGARKVEAIEMEAAGVMEAAAARTDALYPVLVVRGISDVVGYQREADWTTYACNTAAAFAICNLASDIRTTRRHRSIPNTPRRRSSDPRICIVHARRGSRRYNS